VRARASDVVPASRRRSAAPESRSVRVCPASPRRSGPGCALTGPTDLHAGARRRLDACAAAGKQLELPSDSTSISSAAVAEETISASLGSSRSSRRGRRGKQSPVDGDHSPIASHSTAEAASAPASDAERIACHRSPLEDRCERDLSCVKNQSAFRLSTIRPAWFHPGIVSFGGQRASAEVDDALVCSSNPSIVEDLNCSWKAGKSIDFQLVAR